MQFKYKKTNATILHPRDKNDLGDKVLKRMKNNKTPPNSLAHIKYRGDGLYSVQIIQAVS